MKKNLIAMALSSALAVPLASTAIAQESDTSGASRSSSQASSAQELRNDMRASDLLGKTVRNKEGKDLGEVEDVLVNMNSGRVQYTVLSFGGFMGMGDKLFAIPLDSFDRSQQRDHLVLNVSEERLKKAEGFDKDKWPNYREDASFFERTRSAFGSQASREDNREGYRHMMRLSELVGEDVKDSQGRDIGEIEDIVVDMGRGRISYVALDFDAPGDSEDRLIPVPLSALTAPRDGGDELALNIDRDRLDQKRGIDPKNWPNVNDQEHQRSMDRYFTSLGGSDRTAQERGEQTTGDSGESGRTSAGKDASSMTGPTQPRPADDTTNRLREN